MHALKPATRMVADGAFYALSAHEPNEMQNGRCSQYEPLKPVAPRICYMSVCHLHPVSRRQAAAGLNNK
jgi:hypothetical protein